MTFPSAIGCLVVLVTVAACGGSTLRRGDEGKAGAGSGGGSTGSGANDGHGAGASAAGGKLGAGASPSYAGEPALGGSASGGQPNCPDIECDLPMCADGAEPVLPPGACCPVCPPAVSTGCESVMCETELSCSNGYTLTQPPGACCRGCVPKVGHVFCLDIACAEGNHCPLGYLRGDAFGGCCADCVPDPNFCTKSSECLMATRPLEGCECAEAISRREYAADECWSDYAAPRDVPQSCPDSIQCDIDCIPAGSARCIDRRCVEVVD